MSRVFTFAIFLGALALVGPPGAAAVAPPGTPESDTQKVVYLGDKGPILIDLSVRIDGKSFRAVNRELMNSIFDYLDRDGNGVLSKAEAANAPPAAGFNTTFGLLRTGPGRPTTLDANKDGKVTREELAAYYRQAGLAPFQVTATPRNEGIIRLSADRVGGGAASAERITTRLYELLDTDRDGKLSRKELLAAQALLKKLDADEDEMLTTDELMGDARPQGDGVLEVAFSPDGRYLAASGGAATLLAVADGPSDAALARALVAKYGKAGDKALATSRLGLTKAATALLDRDGDGKLSLEELGRFGGKKADLALTVRLGQRADKSPIVEVPGGGKLPAGVRVEKGQDGVTLVVGGSRLEGLGGPSGDGAVRFAGFNIFDQYKTMFQRADADSNGYIDKQEAAKVPFFRDTFAAMDRDGDGMLYEKEMLAYAKKMQSLSALAGRGCVSVVVTNKGKGLFELFDADGDGRLSVRELRNAAKVLDRLDEDKDGALARSEVPNHHRGAFELGPAGGQSGLARVVFFADGRSQAPPRERTAGPLWFRKMDRNRDGDVSRGEFLGTDAQFKAIDADGDGLISAAEADRYDRRTKKSKE